MPPSTLSQGNELNSSAPINLTTEEIAWLKEHPVLKVGNENDWEPFDFTENGEAQGYSIDHLRLIGEKVGLQFDFVNGFTWNELMDMLKNGELDILPAIAETPCRLKFMRFTSHYMENPTVLVVGETHSDLHSLDDLKGMRVAVVGGYYYQESLEREYPEVDIVPVSNFLSGLESIIHENAEAFIGSQVVVNHTIRKHFLGGLRIAGHSGIDDVDKFKLRIGVRKDQQVLLGILEKGMRAISREEKQELANRWIGMIEEGTVAKKRTKLTKEERIWLKAHPEIRLGIDPAWPPFEFLELGQDYSGIAADFVHILNTELGVAMKPVPNLSWAEVMEKTKAGEIDVLPCVVKTPKRSEYLNFSDPYLSKPLVILSREESPYFAGVGDVQGPIAVIDGYFSVELLKRDYPDKNYRTVTTIDEAIKAVERGDADVFVGNLASISYTLQKQGIKSLKVSGYTEYTSDLHFAIRKDWPELVEIINKQLAAIPESEKSRIISSWVNFRVEKEIDWMLLTLWVLGIAVVAGSIVSFYINTNRKLAREVSERKKAEEAADSANQAKSEFLANMSHEIRTPMSAVLGFSEVLKTQEKDPKKLRYIEMIHSSGHALLDLINDILDLSKVEAGKLELQYSSVDIHQLLTELKFVFEKKVVDKRLELIIDTAPDMPEVLLVDQVRVRQVLINLIGNALKFTHEGHIRVMARSQPEGGNLVTLVLEVEDTGIGIPEDQQQKIFSKFEQVKGQKVSQYGGTGLGLAISYRLTQIMGGNLSVDSEEGKGSSFRVALHGIEVAAKKPDEATEDFDAGSISFDPATLLIADDIDHNREIISSFLSGFKFEFLFSENGKDAVEQARKHKPDLILLDMKMPVMDGYEAAEIMGHDEVLRNIPLIAVTASALKEDEAAISKLCDGYLRKPVDRKKLICELMKYLKYSLVEEKAPVEKQDVPPTTARRSDNPEQLSGLLQQLEGEAYKQWEKREKLSIREIGAFAETLIGLGSQFDDPPLSDWGTQLQQAVSAFDIEAINQQMPNFPNIIQELKAALSRLNR